MTDKKPKQTNDAVTVNLTTSATVCVITWDPAIKAWVQGVEREVAAGQHIFTLPPGTCIQITR